MMPTFNDRISPEEISSVMNQTSSQMQQVSQALRDMNGSLGRMAQMFEQVRDYTQDELKELNSYRTTIKSVADEYRKMYGDNLKGMSDFSVAIKANEDKIKSLAEEQKKLLDDNKKMGERNAKIQETLEKGVSGKRKKELQETLGVQVTGGKELRKLAIEELKTSEQKIASNKKALAENRKQTEETKKGLELSEKVSKLGRTKIEQERAARGGSRGVSALEVASDLNLPGVSQAATIAKYARREVDDVPEGLGGMAGMAAKGVGLLKGGLVGGAVAGGAYSMMQGYKAYNLAHQMAPMAKTLRGQGTSAGETRGALEAYGGYGGQENLRTLMTLNKQIGGRAGAASLNQVTDIANAYGMQREEVGGQAGGLFQAGGARPESAAAELKDIMIEGVKGGMDRARITEFTSQIVGLQQDIFKTTGENNAKNVAQALSQLMRASGRGENFLRGPEMQAARGIDSAVRGASRGGGPGAGTIFRAFGFGAGAQAGGNNVGQGYYNAIKETEKGIFGGKNPLERLNKVFDQYYKESGGKKDIARLRMHDEMGIGLTQVEKLDEIRGKKGKLSKEDEKALKEAEDQTKDPMERLLDYQAKMDANLAKLASSDNGMSAILKIDQLILDAQEQAIDILNDIAKLLAPGAEGKGDAAMKIGGGLAGLFAGYKGLGALKDIITGGAAGGAGAGAGGAAAKGLGGRLLAGAGSVAAKVPLIYGAAGAIGGAANAYDMLDDKEGFGKASEKFARRTADYSATDWLMHPGDALTAGGIGLGEAAGSAHNWLTGGKDPDEVDAQLRAQGFTFEEGVPGKPGAKDSATKASAAPRDPTTKENTSATKENTLAMKKLSEDLIQSVRRGSPMDRSQKQQPRGSIR